MASQQALSQSRQNKKLLKEGYGTRIKKDNEQE